MNNPDFLTSAGAASLAHRIVAYWLVKGFDANVWVEPVEATGCYQVRSDLVNGLPVVAAASLPQHCIFNRYERRR